MDLAAQFPIRTEVEVFPLVEANETLLTLKQSEIRGAAVLKVAGL
jgi:D-arabinose 1-dehydrogenase-like Zn-dependent alcohol dehydrogenase